MKSKQNIKSWLFVGLLALMLSACATTQDEIPPEGDGSAVDGGTTDGSGGVIAGGDGSGADASSLDGGDSGAGTSIVDGGADGSMSDMSAMAMLEKTEGDLANRTIYFEYDSAKLTSESIAILETHGNFIAGNGEVSVRLEGHADERGSREYNIALGDRRAQSVRRVLLFQGASSDQIETVSYGEEQPAVEGSFDAAWAKNRRVELIYKVN
jgi:peptidoglycan-associated lipoprotein